MEHLHANGVPEEFFLFDHPDYLEDEFEHDDWFVWPAGHTEYADLTKNDEPDSGNESDYDEYNESEEEYDNEESDEDGDGK